MLLYDRIETFMIHMKVKMEKQKISSKTKGLKH